MKRYGAITICPNCGKADTHFPHELSIIEELLEEEKTKCPHCGKVHPKEYICMSEVTDKSKNDMQNVLKLFTTEQLEAELERRRKGE